MPGLTRYSTPPPIGSRVRMTLDGWAKGKTGTVIEHAELGERARWEKGPIVGAACRVQLDVPQPTRWEGHEIESIGNIMGWEVQALPTIEHNGRGHA